MAETLYVNKPGGVITRRADGSGLHLTYGDPIPEVEGGGYDLEDGVNPKAFADTKKRKPDLAELQAEEANRRAALAENGQVNSSSSPVPGNYSELDEDARVRLVESLARFPEQQAVVLQHEILFGGKSQKVIDAASEYAQASAGVRIDALPAEVTDVTDPDERGEPVVPLPDPDGTLHDPAGAEARVVEAANEQAGDLKGDGSQTPPPSSGSGSTPPPAPAPGTAAPPPPSN